MALPSTFSNCHEYFTEAVDFLKTHSWIYEYANTCFIKEGVLNNFSHEFHTYFVNISNDDLNQFPFLRNINSDLLSQTLQDFRTKLKCLIPPEAFNEPEVNEFAAEPTNLRKMNPKKQHEIARLAQLINKLCSSNNDVLVDFGSGLGYLSEMLNRVNNKFLILGLEADSYRVDAAQKRQQATMPQALNAIVYKQEFISENSANVIVESVQELTKLNYKLQQQKEPLRMTLIGLHACADLTINSMKLFLSMESVSRLIIMPCCYHKLQMSAATKTFTNFPLSKALKSAVDGGEDSKLVSKFFNRPFLRLACQQTLERWRDSSSAEHEAHGMEMFRRGVAEAILDETEMVVKNKKNTVNLNERQVETFAVLCEHYSLRSKVTNESVAWNEQHEVKFNEIIKRYGEEGHKLAEGLTCLQTTMQKLCENIVLFDRLCYMQENAATQGLQLNVRFQKIFNEKLSPRCYVLIAEKL